MSDARTRVRPRAVGLALLGILIGSAPGSSTVISSPDDTRSDDRDVPTLVYVSDYLSFVGADGQGHVAFALDTNRGRDGEAYQAEHFVVLHDEQRGWVEIAGNGAYDNAGRQLEGLPDSSFFHFTGTPRSGLTITSEPNRLTFRVEPIPARLARVHEGGTFWMGSAPAVLEWDGRRLTGRVIYEYLYKPGFNRLTRTYLGLWNDFQGFYLSIGEAGDLYLHRQEGGRLAPLVGELAGFAVLDGRQEALHDLELVVEDHRLAWGFYRWPTAWEIRWSGDAPSTLGLRLTEHRVLATWVVGGFAMGIVEGAFVRDGRRYPFYGLVELIM